MKKLLRHLVFVTAALATSSAMAGVTFYELPDFGGRSFTANGTVADFRAYDFNDRPMSAVVEGSSVEVCADINFSGGCQIFEPGTYSNLGVWVAQISSVRPAYGRTNDQRAYQPRGDEQRRYDQRGNDQRGYQRDYDDRARGGRRN